MAKQTWAFLGLAFAVSWLIWISATRLGAGPGVGEYVLAFGACGPAVAAIFLSRRGPGDVTVRLPVRVYWFLAVWLSGAAVYVVNDRIRGIKAPSYLYYLVVALLAMIPAWVFSGAFSRDAGVRELLRTLVDPCNWQWQAVAFLFFPVLLLVPAAIVHLFGGTLVWPQRRGTLSSLAAYGAVSFVSSFLFTAVSEEPGWRGFLLPRLQRKFSPLLASLLVWVPWALWHAPLDFTGGVGSTWVNYVQIRVIFFIPVTIIMTWLYNRSGANILSTAIFHAGLNTFPFVLPYAPKMLGLLLLWAAYVLVADRMWRRQGAGAFARSG